LIVPQLHELETSTKQEEKGRDTWPSPTKYLNRKPLALNNEI
jgi:hypothetical protein